MKEKYQNSTPECLRCGKCCLANMAALVAEICDDDIERWKKEDRLDILHIIENESPVWVGDHLVSSRTGRPIHGCPFLVWEDMHYACSIYETRPVVCALYIPGASELCPLHKK